MDANRYIKVICSLGDAVGLRYFAGSETLAAPFHYDVEMVSTDTNLDLYKLLGEPMTIALELPDSQARYFHGFVTSIRFIGGLGRYAHYRATVEPWISLLRHTSNCRVFNTSMNAPDRVAKILAEKGFTDIEARLAGKPYLPWEFRVQYRESDLNFISRLLEQDGIYYYFRHFNGLHVMVFADDHGSHDPVPGYETIPYYPPGVRRIRERDHFDSWDMLEHITPGTYTTDDFNFEMPKQGLLRVPLSNPDKYSNANYRVYDYPAEHSSVNQGQRFARLRLEHLKAGHQIFEGIGDVRGLYAGALFTLEGHPREDQNREYLVISSSYEITNNAYESTSPTDEVGYRCAIVAMDSKRPFRTTKVSVPPKVAGPQTARVVGDPGAEITTDPYGRVKVQFHWDQDGQQNQDSSCWVRVAQVWAGTGFGAQFIPRAGQEVIVDFLEGNPDRPIITGSVYNSDNMPPYALKDNKTQSGFKTRSSKGGQPSNFNELRFEDKLGEEELHMQAEKNMSTLVKHDRSASIGANDSVSVGGDRSVSVTGNLSVTVNGKGKSPFHSTLTVTGKHKVHASDTIDMDAPTHVTFVCGGSSITIEPGKITLQAGGGAKIVLDANAFTQAKAQGSLLVDANLLSTSANGGHVLIDDRVLATSAAGHTALVDGGSVKLTAGGSTVTTTTSSVAVNSQTVTANGGPSGLELASAGATMSGPKATVSGAGTTEITGGVVKIN